MQFHVSEYLADTVHLDAEEHGAYLMLLFRYWQTGKPLPNDDAQLARFARVTADRWPHVRNTIEHLFNTCSTEWVHHRLEVDLEEAKTAIEAKSRGGKASAAARKRKTIEARKSGVARPVKELNTCSTPVEHMSNKEEVEVEVLCSKEHSDISEFSDTPQTTSSAIPSKRKKPTQPIPENFTVTREMIAWVKENNLGHINLGDETDRFVDHWKSKGEARADWVAGWRTWIRNADRFQREAAGNRSQRDGIHAAIHGH